MAMFQPPIKNELDVLLSVVPRQNISPGRGRGRARSDPVEALPLIWRLKQRRSLLAHSHFTFEASRDLSQCTVEVNVSSVHEQVLSGRMA